ncbi:MAG: CoA transferase [Chloroflexi bacterium]|nr:CoA transferase [Chloroflexota bacterium]
MNFPEEIRDDPQVQAEGLFVDLEHDITGPQSVMGPVLEMSVTPTAARRASPPLARHTREVLSDAGWSEQEVEALIGSGVVVSS